MKKQFLIIWGIVFYINSQAIAQYNRFEAGIESGPTITCLWGNDIVSGSLNTYNEKWLYVPGYRVGGFFTFNFHKYIGIQTGIYAENIGMQHEIYGYYNTYSNETIDTVYSRLNFNYITFPLIAKIGFGHKWRVNFSLGGFFSRLIESNELFSPKYGNNPDYTVAMGTTQDYDKFNTGFIFGAALDYRFKNHLNIGIEVRDQLGWYGIYPGPVYLNQHVSTNAMQFIFRVSFKLPPKMKVHT